MMVLDNIGKIEYNGHDFASFFVWPASMLVLPATWRLEASPYHDGPLHQFCCGWPWAHLCFSLLAVLLGRRASRRNSRNWAAVPP